MSMLSIGIVILVVLAIFTVWSRLRLSHGDQLLCDWVFSDEEWARAFEANDLIIKTSRRDRALVFVGLAVLVVGIAVLAHAPKNEIFA